MSYSSEIPARQQIWTRRMALREELFNHFHDDPPFVGAYVLRWLCEEVDLRLLEELATFVDAATSHKRGIEALRVTPSDDPS